MSIVSFKNVYLEFKQSNEKSLRRLILNLLKKNQKADNKLIFSNINFTINQGDRVGILGRNGSGKTTILKLINKSFEPNSGDILVKGTVSSLIDLHFGIEGEATGRENIYLKLLLAGKSKQYIDTNIEKIILFSELHENIDEPVKYYSSGMLLKLSIAININLSADILLLDEWLSVGDTFFNKKIEDTLEKKINSSKILFLASHSRELIEKYCNKLMLISDHQIKIFEDCKKGVREYFENT